jgi:RNA polymerase sigma factor (TIGR02999 family)
MLRKRQKTLRTRFETVHKRYWNWIARVFSPVLTSAIAKRRTCCYALRKSEEIAVVASPGYRTLQDTECALTGMPVSREELDYLFSLAYEELRRLAAAVRRSDPSATLSTTALVNEAWLKLAHSPRFESTSHLHFKRIAARAMRQLLVEAARRRNAEKRGGGDETAVLDEDGAEWLPRGEDLLALDMALDELARMNARQALMVEARFFGGMEWAETAELLHCSEATVMRDWRAARAWLAVKLQRT